MVKKTALAKVKIPHDKDSFEWTEQRLKAIDLVLAGIPKTRIAEVVGVHRNTINNWCSTPAFIVRGTELMREHVSATRQRRIMETGALQNKVVRLAQDAVEKLFSEEASDKDKRWAREILFEFRAMRDEERKDFGDDVKRIETRGHMTIGGDVAVNHSTHETPFKEFLLDKMDAGVVDAELLEDAENESELLTGAVEQVLIDGDLLDIIEEEDRRESDEDS